MIMYLVALLIVGVALGTIAATKILDKPLEFVWVTVSHKETSTTNTNENVNTETNSNADTNSSSTATETTWKSFTPRGGYTIQVAYPFGYHVYFDSSLSAYPSRSTDILYISPTPLDNTPRDRAISAVMYVFESNKTQADFTTAVQTEKDSMVDVATTSVTYNSIAWTKMSGMQDMFGEATPKVVYMADLVQSNGKYTIVKAQFTGNTAQTDLLDMLDESVSRTTLAQ